VLVVDARIEYQSLFLLYEVSSVLNSKQRRHLPKERAEAAAASSWEQPLQQRARREEVVRPQQQLE
jgi:hypothetical protein